MRILRVIGSVNPEDGGPIEGIRQITKVLDELGHVTEIVTVDDPNATWLKNLNLKIIAVGNSGRKYSYSRRLGPWLKSNVDKYDVVVQHGLWNYTAQATWRALRNSRTPYFVYPHGMLDPWFRNAYPGKHLLKQVLWWISEGNLLRDAAAVLFTSEEERIAAKKSFWPYRCKEKVVNYGTGDVSGQVGSGANGFSASFPQLKNRPYLLFLSRIHPKKGCDLILHSFASVAHQRPDLDLVIAGPDKTGWRADLERLAADLQIEQRVHWPGMLTGQTKWDAIYNCEAFILPSHQENFGIVVAEAMAAGRPVLITNKVNIWREIESCGGGLISADNVSGFTDMLSRFFSLSRDEKRMMAENARSGFVKYFEIQNVAKSFVDLLEEFVKNGNGKLY